MTNGWEGSAAAWIASQGERGDFGRRFVLDPVMLPRALTPRPARTLDVGCGEGRFCRMLAANGVAATGIDPTGSLLAEARRLDPRSTYVSGAAEDLPFEDAAFDLVVSYLSLIDIPDIERAIPEMARVLEPGGRLLVANLTSFNTAGNELDWTLDASGRRVSWPVDRYMTPRASWVSWRGIRVINHHRPLSTYMKLFLQQGLVLSHFDEPLPTSDAPAERAGDYVRAPWFLVMEWIRPR
ncbi:MAG: class I SAM-dependent methyltransferase [Alphaproteobacteria bacterium]